MDDTPKTPALIDPFDAYLQREGAGEPAPLFAGDFINLNGQTGLWTRNKQPLDTTDPFLVDVNATVVGVVKMIDRKVVDRTHLGFLIDGYVPQARDQLDDVDPRSWPYNRGKHEDPWKPAIYLAMRNKAGEPLVYAPLASTQISAVRAFLAAYRRERVEGKFPLAMLGVRDFLNNEGGTTYVPTFWLCGWDLLDGRPAPDVPLIAVPQAPKALPKPKPDNKPNDDMNDDIPFAWAVFILAGAVAWFAASGSLIA